jgi:diguanylate cyclase (GGDEF)-like protein
MQRWRLAAQDSRLARRLVLVFVLCALAPVLAGTLLSLRSYAQDRAVREQEMARAQAANYGMALIGRLVAFEESLSALASMEGAQSLAPAARRLSWVADAQLLDALALEATGLDRQQRSALAAGEPTLRVVRAPGGPAQVMVMEPVGTGTWLQVTLRAEALWRDIDDYADAGVLRVRASSAGQIASGSGTGQPATGALQPAATWTMFLGGHFHAAPWTIELLRPAPGLASYLAGTPLWLLATGAGTATLIALLATRLVRRELQPFGQLVNAAQRIAHRDFSTPVPDSGQDEFGELARAFNSMSGSLQRDFATLASLAEVDRQLLRSPSLEPILDALLPRIATVLASRAVSVVLLDADAPGHVRAYEHVAGHDERTSVRRLQVSQQELRLLAAGQEGSACVLAGHEAPTLLAPLHAAGCTVLQCLPLEQQQRLFGFLCTGYGPDAKRAQAPGASLQDFADRLGVVLANIEQTRQLRHAAHYDPLTGLANRLLFSGELERAVAHAVATNTRCALLYLDLDDFKQVNDTAGHAAGDELLRTVAARLQQALGSDELAARLGGDEFAVLVRTVHDEEGLRAVCHRLQQALKGPVAAGGRLLPVRASIGVALGPDDGRNAARLLMHGDIAMYRAKEEGRGRIAFFEASMQERMQTRVALETGLQRALAGSALEVHYQPILRRTESGLCAVEALVRWPGSSSGPARSPAEFIPVAEETGLIVELGAWVLQTACRDFAAWRRAGLTLDYVSVNVSAGQLRHEGFEALVESSLLKHRLAPAQLQLEVTESVLVEGDESGTLLGRLAARGVRIALDDFGTGYSSLNYLRRFPVQSIKIDRSFVEELPGNASACRLVEAMLAMAAAVDVQVIAEGVETRDQAVFLNDAGCDALQGFLFSKALPQEELLVLAQRMLGGDPAGIAQSA